ncbi:uncharacterized protein LOC116339326, partial [Contarinia nasturtii]|uniref:uncharacterized protein LOC116339326 n=1 Tax=Contarinia nasturtii TaxID=265458 RepID=UPI0012D44CBD
NNEVLSNLPHPFFYYLALLIAAVGLVVIFVSLIGWWTIFWCNYCNLSIYFLVVLLLFESTFCSMVTVWPKCVGLQLNESLMVKILQNSYGVQQQMTDSIDLIQTHFKCCAISSNVNYDMSLWKLQNFGQKDWTVPQTCCILKNINEERSYLDPKPMNISLCQSLLKHEYNGARHSENCLEHLNAWYQNHYFMFLKAGAFIAIVEFMVLVSIILSCIQITKSTRKSCRNVGTSMATNLKKRMAPQPQFPPNENLYFRNVLI